MPNPTNAISPINIHGFGRSGTTLLQNLLGHYPFIQVCNETIHLVFHAYRGGELLLGSNDKETLGRPHDGKAGGQVVRGALCTLQASSKPIWCQKLGGIPNTITWAPLMTDADYKHSARPYPFPYAWYWQVLRESFPLSNDLLILRNWREIVASRVKYSKYNPRDMVEALTIYLNMMSHPESRFDLVFRLEELTASPADIMQKICTVLGIEYDDACLRMMEWYAAGGRSDLATARAAGFSWRQDYDMLGPAFDKEAWTEIQPAVARIKDRFGIDLDT
jgi:hypothetical protein